jgi:two-component system sensor histidine kinase TctE
VDVDVEGDAWVKGDAVLLRQALLVLVDNALRYTPSESHLTLRGRPEGDEVLLEVEDAGPGIPVEVRKRLAGGRGGRGHGDAATEEKGARSGRGLSIVQWITEAHDGRVTILDAPSGGAVVRIALPVPLSSS